MLYLDQRQQVSPTIEVWADVSEAQGAIAEPATLIYTWNFGVTLVAPMWDGIVQSTSCEAGGVIEDGSVVARINDVDRIAAHTPAPFYRPLAVEDRGEDVRMLNELLQRQGLTAGDGDRFDWKTRIGVMELSAKLQKRDSSSVDIFDPGWVVFLPDPRVTVASCSLSVASPAPAQGEEILVSASTITHAEVGAATVLDLVPPPSDDEEGGAPAAIVLEDSERMALSSEQALSVNGEPIAFDYENQVVAPESLPLLSSLVQENTPASRAQVQRDLVAGGLSIPASAVLTTSDDQTCVVTRSESEDGYTPVKVEVLGLANGDVVITGPIEVG
ncbi:MAG: hypothetical protein Q8Q19_20265, partial [Microbacterium sp.]|nr:hypothetical protein [Microbacterium sp.]